MRHFFIGFAILIVVVAVAFQPSGGAQDQPSGVEPETAVIGDDDLPNGAPVQLAAAAKIMPVCIQGPMHATPQCRYNSVTECRADCRRKRSRPELSGSIPGTYRHNQVSCFRNPAYRGPIRPVPRELRVGMAADSIARELYASRKI
jgi:hypothetical protein